MTSRKPEFREVRSLILRVRCTKNERASWAHKAASEERSLSDYARHVLSVEPLRRRTRPPKIDPILLAAIARTGNNLNQISRALNIDRKAGRVVDLIAVRTIMMTLDRQLSKILKDHSR